MTTENPELFVARVIASHLPIKSEKHFGPALFSPAFAFQETSAVPPTTQFFVQCISVFRSRKINAIAIGVTMEAGNYDLLVMQEQAYLALRADPNLNPYGELLATADLDVLRAVDEYLVANSDRGDNETSS